MFLIDENVTSSIVKFLRSEDYKVHTLQDLKRRGITNGEVAQIALKNHAIIITFDSDYLKLKKEIQAELRIIYIHMYRINPMIAKRLLEKHLETSLNHLKDPGKIIITENSVSFKKPFEL